MERLRECAGEPPVCARSSLTREAQSGGSFHCKLVALADAGKYAHQALRRFLDMKPALETATCSFAHHGSLRWRHLDPGAKQRARTSKVVASDDSCSILLHFAPDVDFL